MVSMVASIYREFDVMIYALRYVVIMTSKLEGLSVL